MNRRQAVWRAASALLSATGAASTAHAQDVPTWSLEAQRRLLGGAGADLAAEMAERARLIQAAETALANGDVQTAAQAFERAAGMVHSQDVEMGIVRTQMQSGQYRQALSFASHAAGAHPRAPAGTALYVWLLHIGGQANAARRYLQEGLQRHPEDAALLAAQALLLAAHPVPGPALMAAPLRAAPYAHGEAVAPGAVCAGTACLLTAEGDAEPGPVSSMACVPAATLQGASRIWVRNGLGQTTLVQPADGASDTPTQRLRLATPLPLPAPGAHLQAPNRPAFAGSPACTVEYGVAAAEADSPTWPLLRLGFFGHLPAGASPRRLTMDLAEGPRGGPVFDAQGRLAGLAVPMGPREAGLVPGPRWAAPAPAPAAPLAVDQIYEVALRLALQVIVLR